MKSRLTLSCLLLFFFFNTIVFSQIIHVTPSGSGLKDGSSWANALAGNDSAASGYTRLADTLRHALSGAEFWVAEGTYLPCWDNDRNKSFEIVQNISVYGGFSGIEQTTSDRNWQLHQTVFSGNIGLDSLKTDNAYHVIITSGPYWTSHAFLDGLIICDGYAQDPSLPSSSSQRNGGGIYSSHKLTIRNCIFSDNTSYNGGGAIYAKDYAMTWWMVNELILENCEFRNNSLLANNYGGSVYITRDYVSMTTSIRNCRFVNNSGWHGSAVYARGNCNLINCLVANNSSNYGALVTEYGTMTITNSTIVNNSGGGIRIKTSGILNIRNSIVWGGGTITGMSGYTYTANSCCVEGGANGVNIIAEDPIFQAPTTGLGASFNASNANWNLRWCSPCFNSGDTTLLPYGLQTDLDGNSRILYSSVDMGALELDTTGIIPNAVGFQNNLIFVTDSNVYYGDGGSWQSALAGNAESCKYPGQTLLYEAMKDAEPGTKIWVKKGLYKSSISDNREHAFTLGPGVHVTGGFNGTEIHPEERIQDGIASIFSGEIGDSLLLNDNTFHVFKINPQGLLYTDTAYLERISVEQGYADGISHKGEGAGLLVEGGVKLHLSEVTIQNNVSKGNGAGMRVQGNAYIGLEQSFIQNNRILKFYSSPTQSYSANGAGIYNSGVLFLLNSTIRHNDSATMGGGIYSEDSVQLSNCTIDSNYSVTTYSKGGGLSNSGFCILIKSTVSGNTAQLQAGGIMNLSGAELVLDSCTIHSNRNLQVASNGGGIYNLGSTNIRKSEFIENESKSDGGGLYNASSASASISESRFYKNNASGYSTIAGGGGIFNAGILNIERSYLCNNTTSGSGGGIYNPTRVSNCLIANNTKGGTLSTGGGIRISNACQGIYHSTIVNNNGQGIAATSVSGQTMQEIPITDTTLLVNSIVYGNSLQVTGHFHKNTCLIQDDHSGGSVFFGDPVFINPTTSQGPGYDGLNADWNLSSCSQAIDRADPFWISASDSVDVSGNIRISGTNSDLGALEFQGTPIMIDYSHPVIYVNADSSDGGSGLSWAEAIHGNAPSCRYPGYSNLYEVMRDVPDSCQIWVTQGLYPCGSDTSNTRSYMIKEGLKMFGSFFGIEISPVTRDINQFPTILTSNLASNNNSSNDPFNILQSYPQSNSWSQPAYLDGLSITGGKSDFYSQNGSSNFNYYPVGTGIVVNLNVHLILSNCTVSNNKGISIHTINPDNVTRIGGGGIFNKGILELKNTTISHNITPTTGGGIYNEGELIIDSCLIKKNSVNNSGSISFNSWGGGGLYNNNTGVCIIRNSIIDSNSLNNNIYGGGIHSRGRLEVLNSLITGNVASRNGGGIYSTGNLKIRNSTFKHNFSGYYGGAICCSDTAIIDNSMFLYNSGCSESNIRSTGFLRITNCELSHSIHTCQAGSAGGIATTGTTYVDYCVFHHHNTKGFIYKNTGGMFSFVFIAVGSDGAGILQTDGELFVDHSLFYKNICGGGAGVAVNGGKAVIKNSIVSECYAADGSAFQNKSDLTVENCLVANNADYWGGAFINLDSAVTNIFNTTIVNNLTGSSQWNDALFKHGRFDNYTPNTFHVKNSVLWNDGPVTGYYPGSTGFDSITFSCVKGGFPGIGNINDDPIFPNPLPGFDTIQMTQWYNYRLHPCSPCINAGNDSLVADTLDLDGNPRIVEHVDMGAYEYPVVETGHRIFGSIYYDNEDTTAVDSVWVILRNETMAIDSFQTRAPGEYCFSNVQPGQYHIECRSVRTSGGSSSLDAFLILKHFTQFNFLTGLRLLAASTDTYPWINAIDGLLVHRKFTGAIPHYNAPEWIFETKTVIMTNENLNVPIRAICRGDVDASFEP